MENKIKELRYAIVQSVPVMLGYLFLGFAFGLMLMMLDMDSGGPFYQPVCICGKHAICLGYVTYSRSKPVVYIDHDTVCQWQTYVYGLSFVEKFKKWV